MSEASRTDVVPPLPDLPAEPALPAGSRIAGRYEVRGLLGQGGFAQVYRVWDAELRREVALKLLRPERATAAALVRLRREAAVARDASSPNLARIFDIERDGERTFLTLELIEGRSLRERLQGGPLPVDEAIRIAEGLLAGLVELHRIGVLHRDVKPGNVLLDPGGVPKLADFGLAKSLDRDETRATVADALVGTVEYLSPEQALGEEPDARSDLYSVGVVLFEMLTGELPHGARTPLGALLAHVQREAPDVRAVRKETPRWLAGVVRRLLERRPQDRYDSAAAVLADVRQRRRPLLPRGRAWRRAALVGGSLLGLGALAAWALHAIERPRFSHLVALEGSGVAAIDQRGARLWTLPGEDPDQASRFALARLEAGDPPRLVGILRGANDFAPDVVRTLSVLDAQSGRVLRRIPLPLPSQRLLAHATRYRPEVVAAQDLDGDGVDEIVVSFVAAADSPSYTVLYEPVADRSRLLFEGSGHHTFVRAVDVDGDGRPEILVAGINNAYGWYNVLAALKVSPWIGRPARADSSAGASSPDAQVAGVGTLFWYALLPRGNFSHDPSSVVDDPASRILTVRFLKGGTARLGYDGFLTEPASKVPSAARAAARAEAYQHLFEAQRLSKGGFVAAALGEVEQAVARAHAADDALLVECAEREKGKILIGSGREGDGESLFDGLARSSPNASEVAFDAARALHLRGRLDRAIAWYERGLGPGGEIASGKSKFEFLMGMVLALGEEGRFDEAEAKSLRFNDEYPSARDVGYFFHEYARWRRGARPEIALLNISALSAPVLRYFLLEYRAARGEDPAGLLTDLAAVMQDPGDAGPGLLSLRGELLARLGRAREALAASRQANDEGQATVGNSTVVRAIYDLIVQRFAKLASAAGDPGAADRALAALRAWQADQPGTRR